MSLLCCALAASHAKHALAEINSLPLVAVMKSTERQVTHRPTGHILTNTGVWSPDGEWLVYDTRSDPAGNKFDGSQIEMVKVGTGEVKVLYQAMHGAHCGVATFHPREKKVVFILGPEYPTRDWQYCAWHRQGVIVNISQPGKAHNLDARDVVPPFTAGALRGGSHVHVWDSAGEWVSFTYEDHVLAGITEEKEGREINLRNIGVGVPGHAVKVPRTHPRNHDGECFSVLITRTRANPERGSDQISKAFEEGWVGTNGYVRSDGSRQQHALAFQGQVLTAKGESISEVFIVDLPDDLTIPGDGPLAGTQILRPFPPQSTAQRRLTFTADRKYPGIQGPRHWLRSSPSGDQIAFLMKDDDGVVQLWTVSPNGGPPSQLTHNPLAIGSTFTWSPDGSRISHVMDDSVCLTDTATGKTTRLTPRCEDAIAPQPEACVFSPDGKKIAYVRPTPSGKLWFNQIWVVGVVE
jgi:WD40 repeat protein